MCSSYFRDLTERLMRSSWRNWRGATFRKVWWIFGDQIIVNLLQNRLWFCTMIDLITWCLLRQSKSSSRTACRRSTPTSSCPEADSSNEQKPTPDTTKKPIYNQLHPHILLPCRLIQWCCEILSDPTSISSKTWKTTQGNCYFLWEINYLQLFLKVCKCIPGSKLSLCGTARTSENMRNSENLEK